MMVVVVRRSAAAAAADAARLVADAVRRKPAAVLGLPTGCPKSFGADMIAVAKRDLRSGEMLDGPGAYTTYGQLVPAEESLRGRFLPTGFSEKVKVIRPVAKDSILTYDDVEIDENLFSYKLRKTIEAGRI
jgi:predicted homoserine dehydrogenase-like protein